MPRSKAEILADLQKAVETWDFKMSEKVAHEAMEAKIPPLDAIEKGLGKGMMTLSDRFDRAEVYLPQILAASLAMQKAMDVFKPAMKVGEISSKGKIVIATVEGDIHEIGKNVVSALLVGSGYTVYDLGRDVPIEKFIETAEENDADVVGASALMTTTLLGQRDIVERLKEEGLRAKTIFGGAPCNQHWVSEIGGDAYGENASEAIDKISKLIEKK
ncbi:Methionine synthase [anaerobic digester metagenome]|jgi:corrinoid protein of di/trimethylamine methyltransferase|nr:corrinoid protein [Methanomassiliicoccales archaeon]